MIGYSYIELIVIVSIIVSFFSITVIVQARCIKKLEERCEIYDRKEIALSEMIINKEDQIEKLEQLLKNSLQNHADDIVLFEDKIKQRNSHIDYLNGEYEARVFFVEQSVDTIYKSVFYNKRTGDLVLFTDLEQIGEF